MKMNKKCKVLLYTILYTARSIPPMATRVVRHTDARVLRQMHNHELLDGLNETGNVEIIFFSFFQYRSPKHYSSSLLPPLPPHRRITSLSQSRFPPHTTTTMRLRRCRGLSRTHLSGTCVSCTPFLLLILSLLSSLLSRLSSLLPKNFQIHTNFYNDSFQKSDSYVPRRYSDSESNTHED